MKNGDWVVLTDLTDSADPDNLHFFEELVQHMNTLKEMCRMKEDEDTSNKNTNNNNNSNANSAQGKSSEGSSEDSIVVAPQFRLFLVFNSRQKQQKQQTQTQIHSSAAIINQLLSRMSYNCVRYSFEPIASLTLDVLLPEYDALSYPNFDLLTSYSLTTTSRDCVVSDRRGYPRAKLLRTLSDEIHRPVTDEQSRQYRRLRFSLSLMHARITTYLANRSKIVRGDVDTGDSSVRARRLMSSLYLSRNVDVLAEEAQSLLSSLLRRRMMHQHCVYALSGFSGSNTVMQEPGVDSCVVEWLRSLCLDMYTESLSTNTNRNTNDSSMDRNIISGIIHDTICVRSAVDPKDALYPYDWQYTNKAARYSEPLLLGPHVEPPIRKSKGKKKRRRRQKRITNEEHKRTIAMALKRYQEHVRRSAYGRSFTKTGSTGSTGSSSSFSSTHIAHCVGDPTGITSPEVSMLLCTQVSYQARSYGLAMQGVNNAMMIMSTHQSYHSHHGPPSTNFLLSRLRSVLNSIPSLETQNSYSILMSGVDRLTMMERCRRREMSLLSLLIDRMQQDLRRTMAMLNGTLPVVSQCDMQLLSSMQCSLLSTNHTGCVPDEWNSLLLLSSTSSSQDHGNGLMMKKKKKKKNVVHINVWMLSLRERIHYVAVELKKEIGRLYDHRSRATRKEVPLTDESTTESVSVTTEPANGVLHLRLRMLYRPDAMMNALRLYTNANAFLNHHETTSSSLATESTESTESTATATRSRRTMFLWSTKIEKETVVCLEGLIVRNAYWCDNALVETLPSPEERERREEEKEGGAKQRSSQEHNTTNSRRNTKNTKNTEQINNARSSLFLMSSGPVLYGKVVEMMDERMVSMEEKKKKEEKTEKEDGRMYMAPLIVSGVSVGAVRLNTGEDDVWRKRSVHLST